MNAPTTLSELSRRALESQMHYYVKENREAVKRTTKIVTAADTALVPSAVDHLVVTNARACAASRVLDILDGREAMFGAKLNDAYDAAMKSDAPKETLNVYLEALAIINRG